MEKLFNLEKWLLAFAHWQTYQREQLTLRSLWPPVWTDALLPGRCERKHWSSVGLSQLGRWQCPLLSGWCAPPGNTKRVYNQEAVTGLKIDWVAAAYPPILSSSHPLSLSLSLLPTPTSSRHSVVIPIRRPRPLISMRTHTSHSWKRTQLIVPPWPASPEDVGGGGSHITYFHSQKHTLTKTVFN